MVKWLKKWCNVDTKNSITIPELQEEQKQLVSTDTTNKDYPFRINEGLMDLNNFIELLNSKNLIGVYKSPQEEGNSFLDGLGIKTIFSYTIFSSDGCEFHFKYWTSTVLDIVGSNHYITFSAYQIIPSAAQGDLFDDPTILSKPKFNKCISNNMLYDKTGYNPIYYNLERQNHLKAVGEKSIERVLKLIEGLPEMKSATLEVPVFNKLWEQMELPLDNEIESAKL